MNRATLDALIDANIKTNSANEITAAKHNQVDKAIADYAEDYTDDEVASEVTARDGAIAAAIANEVSDRNSAIAGAIANEVNARNNAISDAIAAEVLARDGAISSAIASEVTARDNAIAAAILSERDVRYSAFGAVYDSGTWKMHNVGGTYLVTGLTAEDMEKICASPDFTTGVIFAGAMRGSAKTNRGIDAYRIVRAANQPVDFTQMARGNTSLQVFYAQASGAYTYCVDVMNYAFYGCTALKIVKYLDVSRCTAFTDSFKNCSALEECYLKGVDADLDLGAASNLTQDSLIYIVENAGTSAKALTFTGGLVSGWVATEDYPTFADFETFAQAKNFTFVTT